MGEGDIEDSITEEEKEWYGRIKKIHLRIGHHRRENIEGKNKGVEVKEGREETEVRDKGIELGNTREKEEREVIREGMEEIRGEEKGQAEEIIEEWEEQKEEIERKGRDKVEDIMEKFRQSAWYKNIMIYVTKGIDGLVEEGLSRNVRKVVANKGQRYMQMNEELF
ncbi:hypothetical protein BGX38DRAFT_1276758 [Terfezia claveryi]|nr:hypothetical protein BGX38DRAFT_1276758 [Terfezia claveryi]